MKHYLLLTHGVYIQGIIGVYTKLADALTNGFFASEEEYDDYHTFDIIKFNINDKFIPNSYISDTVLFTISRIKGETKIEKIR